MKKGISILLLTILLAGCGKYSFKNTVSNRDVFENPKKYKGYFIEIDGYAKPKIENAEKLKAARKFVVCGMGGSNHPTDILKAWKPQVEVVVHRDYGLPLIDLSDSLIIACSYSGNTEEPIDAFETALERSLPVAAISKGGKLGELAHRAAVPYVEIPDTDIQPRSASGFMFMAILKLMQDESSIAEARALASRLTPESLENAGSSLAQKLTNKVPVIYASTLNAAVANNWKIKFNENTKIPSFANVFPELNHNEMNGFNAQPETLKMAKQFGFIFLSDDSDDRRIIKRMHVLEQLFHDRRLTVENVPLVGLTRLQKIFSSLLLADWTSLKLAAAYGVDPEPVPMVEEFKKLII